MLSDLQDFSRIYSNMENLVLRARSKIIGSAIRNEKALNPKHEIRNPKQYLMTKIQMIQTISVLGVMLMVLFLSLGHLIFEFVSDFEIRISNLANARPSKHALWVMPKPCDPLNLDFYFNIHAFHSSIKRSSCLTQ